MNRLAKATSPYLLQHRDNPVEWWEWGHPAFDDARRTGRPVMLSIGYAACHWCHVMAHESFENVAVAALMNELFVNIKVDREERPDVDHVYMSALHLLGEQGGWPLTMFLDADGKPFWGGTYFPPQARFGRPGFAHILRSIAAIYHDQPERIRQNTAALTSQIAASELQHGGPGGGVSSSFLNEVGNQLKTLIDPLHGGLAGAPKFPNPTLLELLMRHALRTGDRRSEELAALTLDQMARGGIHDHIGGGFARYSVDERWLVPHFEKMLYDNAQLLELFAVEAARSGGARPRAAAEGIVAWLTREMVLPGGGFASSLDADSEGEEGRFYVWSRREVEDVLGERARPFSTAYDITEHGNFEGHNILNRLLSEVVSPEEEGAFAVDRAALLRRRGERTRPGLDDKVLADWNGLMIAALVRASILLDEPDWLSLAERAFAFVAGEMADGEGLAHSWREGARVAPGFALDHAAMMRAALALHEATGRDGYLDQVIGWRDHVLSSYLNPDSGCLAMTADAAEALIARPCPTRDDAVPNANGVFCEVLVRLAQITGQIGDRTLAETQLDAALASAQTAPLAHASILNAFDLHTNGLTFTVVRETDGPLTHAALRWPYLTRSVARYGSPDALPTDHPAAALARGADGAIALVCAGMRCSIPATSSAALAASAAEILRPPG